MSNSDLPDFATSAIDMMPKIFANAHQQTVQKIKDKGRPIEQIENYLDTRIKNDPILVRQILRVGFSAYTNNPINLAVLAPTSEGKTYATVQVTQWQNLDDNLAMLQDLEYIEPILVQSVRIALANRRQLPTGGMIFTDDRAPIEWITNQMVLNNILNDPVLLGE